MTKVAALLVSSRKIIASLLGLFGLCLGLVQCTHDPHAISMEVSPGTASLTAVGQTVQFEALADVLTGRDSSTENLTDQVSWSSSSTSVATINASGLATAVTAGTTTIRATLTGSNGAVLQATATLTISSGAATAARDLASITIVPSSQNVSNVGEQIQFDAVGNFSAPPTAVELTSTSAPPVTWSSSDTTIATISSTGLAKSVSPGTTTIIATATAPVSGATIIGTATLTVSATAVPRDLVSITIIPSSQGLSAIGEPTQFTAIGNFSSSPTTVELTNSTSPAITWASSDVTVATINSAGLATSVSGGTATITASAVAPVSGATIVGVATLTVTAPTTVQRDLTSITIIPSSQNVTNVGQAVQFTAIGNYNAAPATVDLTGTGLVTWKSSDASVASINSAGLAIASVAGTTTITATATAPVSGATIIGTATLTVSATAGPRDLTSITIIPSSQTVTSVGEATQFKAIGNYSANPATVDITSQVAWNSSDLSVATVNSSGLATAISGGTTTITATAIAPVSGSTIIGIATLSASASAVVRDLTSITIIPSSQTVNALGESAQFIAIGNYSGSPTTVDLTNQVTWQSNDVQVVNINSDGLATANQNDEGTATITASAAAPVSGNLIVGTATFTNNGTSGNLVPTLTVTELGAGSGTVTSSATATTQAGLITCPPTSAANACSASYPVGTTVTLTATPASGSSFGGWSANCTPVTANSCEVNMNGNEPVAAIFNLN